MKRRMTKRELAKRQSQRAKSNGSSLSDAVLGSVLAQTQFDEHLEATKSINEAHGFGSLEGIVNNLEDFEETWVESAERVKMVKYWYDMMVNQNQNARRLLAFVKLMKTDEVFGARVEKALKDDLEEPYAWLMTVIQSLQKMGEDACMNVLNELEADIDDLANECADVNQIAHWTQDLPHSVTGRSQDIFELANELEIKVTEFKK